MSEQYFSVEEIDRADIPDADKLDFVWFNDEVGRRQIFANDLRAFLDFKDQLEMMKDGDMECSFEDLSRQAKELEKTFKICAKSLRGRNRR